MPTGIGYENKVKKLGKKKKPEEMKKEMAAQKDGLSPEDKPNVTKKVLNLLKKKMPPAPQSVGVSG